MGFIQKLLDSHKQQVKTRNEACDALLMRVEDSIKSANNLFLSPTSFVDPQKEIDWHQDNLHLLLESEEKAIRHLSKANRYKVLHNKQGELHAISSQLNQRISDHNQNAAELRIEDAYNLIGPVEGRNLDEQQMTCLVKDIHNHLVIAGAGTGKTTTVVGKIKYLLKSGKHTPEEILVLSFTNASASEMSQRINKETGCNIAASTFHKLGLNIITKVDGIVPKITQLNLRKFVKEQLAINMDSPKYLRLLTSYLLFNQVYSKSEFDFATQTEYTEHLKLNPPHYIKR